MKHTELPWTIGGDGADIFGPGTPPGYGDSHHVADCQDEGGLLGMRVVDCENAKFIVKACNNHYQLLKALENIKKHMEISCENPRVSAVWNIANKAIKKAEQ